MHDLQPLISVAEAAAILGVARHTLDVWACQRTHGPAFVKVGRRRMYTRAALEAYLAERTIAVGSA